MKKVLYTANSELFKFTAVEHCKTESTAGSNKGLDRFMISFMMRH